MKGLDHVLQISSRREHFQLGGWTWFNPERSQNLHGRICCRNGGEGSCSGTERSRIVSLLHGPPESLIFLKPKIQPLVTLAM